MYAENRGSADLSRRETEIATAPPGVEVGNPAAPRLEPPSVLRGLFEQFGHPSGRLGALAGLLMSRTANDDRWVVDLLDVQPTDRCLDVGCGPGVTLQLLAERADAGLVAGVDPSDVMLRQASHRNRHALQEGRLELRQATAAQLPFQEGSFNRVCAVHSIYFWPSLAEGLRELQRVLTPSGRTVIAVRMQHANAGRLDPSRYGVTEQDLEAIVKHAEILGFQGASVRRRDALDRQTMAAIVAHK